MLMCAMMVGQVSGAILSEDPLAACSAPPPPSTHRRGFADDHHDGPSSSNAHKFEFVEPDPDTLEGKYMLKLAEHLEQHRKEVARLKQVNIWGAFREHSGNIQGTFREHSGTHCDE
jgi:hypothetical protein